MKKPYYIENNSDFEISKAPGFNENEETLDNDDFNDEPKTSFPF